MTIQWLEPGKLLPLASGQRERVTPYSIPYLEGGGPIEEVLWREGFSVEFLPTVELTRYEEEEFAAESRFAWSASGIVIGAKVRQRDFTEAGDVAKLWSGSSIEIIVAGRAGGQSVPLHAAIAPGIDPAFPKPRIYLHSVDSKHSPEVHVNVTREAGGYRFFAIIPWEALPNLEPREGGEFTMQLYLNQGLRPATKRLAWYPSGMSSSSPELSHPIILSKQASSPCRGALSWERGEHEGVLTFHGLPADAGKYVQFKEGNTVLGEAKLVVEGSDRVARASLSLPLPKPGQRWGVLEATFDGQERYQLEPRRHLADYEMPGGVTLEYSAVHGDSTATPYSKKTEVLPLTCWPGMFLQRVELTGLAADTLYRFCPEGSSEAWNFRTLPEQLTRPIRIAMGGDTLHRKEWLEETTLGAVAHDPDFVVWGGDLADANGIPEAITRWKQWFSAIDNTLRTKERRVVPLVVAIGNHDVKKGYYYKHPEYKPTDKWRKYLAPEFYEFFAFPGQPGYGVLDIGDYLSLIILDSAHTNPIAGAQTEWLEQTLAERAARPHVVPIYHIPAYPSVKDYHGKNETEVRRHWPPLFDRYVVRTAFEHHNHAYKRTVPLAAGRPVSQGGTVYFGDGAWGVKVRPVHDAQETWYLEKAVSERYFIILTLEGNQQKLNVFTPDGALLDEYSTWRGQ